MGDKGLPVDRGRTIFLKSLDMYLGTVPLVGSKTILRHDLVILVHEPVPGHFRQNTGCRDGNALGISLDDRNLGNRNARDPYGVVEKRCV